MSADKNRKPAQDFKWIAFQSILGGIVILLVVGLLGFMFFLMKMPGHNPVLILAEEDWAFYYLAGFTVYT